MPRPYPIKMKTYTFKEAEESFRRYPYYIYPALSALAVATQEQRAILVRRIAAAVGDEAMLRTAIGIDPAEFADFYPDMKAPELSTSETIDTFISTFSSEKEHPLPPSTTLWPHPPSTTPPCSPQTPTAYRSPEPIQTAPPTS